MGGKVDFDDVAVFENRIIVGVQRRIVVDTVVYANAGGESDAWFRKMDLRNTSIRQCLIKELRV